MHKIFNLREKSPEIKDEINVLNIRSISKFSFIVSIIESILLLVFSIVNWREIFTTKFASFISVFVIVIISAIVAVYFFGLKNSVVTNRRTLKISQIVAIIYFIAASIWGMVASYRNYIVGEQILTFYIVELAFISFVTFDPLVSFTVIPANFIIFYYALYMFDKGASINLENYIVYILISILVSVNRYQRDVQVIKQNRQMIQLNQSLDQLSQTDELTSLNNRLAYRKVFQSLLNKRVMIMMLDVDNFKYFNDSYGHSTGDAILKEIGKILVRHFTSANCYRYGGDEFVVAIADVDEQTIHQTIQQMEKDIHSIHIDKVDKEISCSYGYKIAQVYTVEALRKLMKDADDALYEMKQEYHRQMDIG